MVVLSLVVRVLIMLIGMIIIAFLPTRELLQ